VGIRFSILEGNFMNFLKSSPILMAFLVTSACTTAPTKMCRITERDVLVVQQAWGDAVVAMGKAKDYKVVAAEYVDQLYAYDSGPVLFKPTKASVKQFRATKEEAISYFVGGKVREDVGFARAPYTNVRFENAQITVQCNTAFAMGNYYFMQPNGREVKVEYTFGYIVDKNGNLRINLHHSSLPYYQR
jgi:hypothetical protein